MLLLLTPPAIVLRCDRPAAPTLAVAREFGADLAGLDWVADDLPFTDELLGLALRHGHACSTGLVVDAALVHPGRLRRTSPTSPSDVGAYAARAALVRSLLAGTGPFGPGSAGAAAAEAAAEGLAEPVPVRAVLLSAPVSDALVAHWRALGDEVL